MWKKSKVTDQTASGQGGIKKRSKVPGVMITQFVEEIPEGKSHPDFTRKPIALTIQEGKLAIFKAIVIGDPQPEVTWSRANGEITDKEKFQNKYDDVSHEHTLEIPNVTSDEADTYKCFATNEYGKAVCTVVLNIIEVGFKKKKEMKKTEEGSAEPVEFRKILKKRDGTREEKPMESEEKVWEILLSADKKDYESICAEYGITDFRGMLKRLKQMKKEREEEIAQFVEKIGKLKPITVSAEDSASFEIDMDLKDPSSRIFLYKDGVMVPYTKELDLEQKHNLKQVGKKFIFTIKNLDPKDAGLYQVDVEGVPVFSTDFKIPPVEFAVKIQEVKAEERQDALFQCVLTVPLNEITWMGKNCPLQNDDKFEITVSEDKLIHKLLVKDCLPLDSGIYAAVAGIKSCNAWLIVEADKNPETKGKKKERKTTMAGASDLDLEKIAQEQQEKYKKDMEAAMLAAKKAQADREAAEAAADAEAEAARAAAKAAKDAARAGAGAGDASADAAPKKKKTTKKVVKKMVAPAADGSAGADGAAEGGAAGQAGADGMVEVEVEVEVEEDDEEEEVVVGKKKRVRDGPLIPDTVVGESNYDDDETSEDVNEKKGKSSRRKKEGPLLKEETVDPGVHFHSGLEDCSANVGEPAELVCKLSSEDCEGVWYKDGEEIKSSDGITISKDGTYHKLKIHNVTGEYAGTYRFEADGRKTESTIVVEDPPRFDSEGLKEFVVPITVKKGHKATFKMPFGGRDPVKIQWYLEGEELSDESNIRIEHTEGHSRLLLNKLQRKDSGEVKIKIKNEFGTTEAVTQLIVLDKPTPPMGPLEIIEASQNCIDIKWRGPKDSGGCKIDNYIMERQQVGRNTWKKLGLIGAEAHYKDSDVDHGRRYCYRIRVETEIGTSELMETEDVQAGTKAYPGAPSVPKVVSAFKDCINLAWSPPSNTGGTNILGYNMEKRKKGSNLWGPVNPPDEPIKGKTFGVKDVIEGMEYEFRVSAINNSGAGEFSTPSEFVFARDPKKPPGKVIDLKVTDSTYTTLCLSWTKPKDIEKVEDEAKGYFVEIRPAENPEWDRCNSNAITMTSFTVKGLKSMAMYWVRLIATNDGGEGQPQELDNYILAMPPPVRPRFTDAKIKSFMVVRAGNSARFNINFEASPWPEVTWLKDSGPVSKRVTISNAEGASQLLIPSAERCDTGIYTIMVKNIVGQETFSIEIRVTDEPKPPGPVEVEENVPGTVTVSWTPSPDEKRDDRLHYMVSKRDSNKRQWNTVADHIFNNKFTACNIMPGRDYQFRVYAKNDMGSSKPSESPKWSITGKKEKFLLNMPESKTCNLERPPKFLVPLKKHTAPEGYECYMSCAVRGDPTPHVTWYRNNISLNTNTNYYISNTCGVCSMLILRVGPKDTGEYKIIAENPLGRAECATKLTVRD
ncbi:immunoglobulin-like and fibronectin type III domain-containing protein 1 isoform X3 [Hypomesus transpacificus]|uniref:immunoglobulin-like and fibronectin type III domain-containing protein 1 isoform X3 n=1 Tax=Hypomesus transpacificus TaxID=137520 RepID=UPI001F079090|nr:immunoglobulin-like and fibronectin type III domain-containing protein 1 isoform X3 [Hypomesus transpacificus]